MFCSFFACNHVVAVLCCWVCFVSVILQLGCCCCCCCCCSCCDKPIRALPIIVIIMQLCFIISFWTIVIVTTVDKILFIAHFYASYWQFFLVCCASYSQLPSSAVSTLISVWGRRHPLTALHLPILSDYTRVIIFHPVRYIILFIMYKWCDTTRYNYVFITCHLIQCELFLCCIWQYNTSLLGLPVVI